MKKIVLLVALAATTSLLAQDKPAESKLDEKSEKLIRQSVPVCPGMKVTRADTQVKLPARFTGSVIRIEAPRTACNAQYLLVFAPSGDYFVGLPWFLGDDVPGKTYNEKLKNFAWTNMQENFNPVIDPVRTRNGLLKVTMWEMTERGKVPLEGELDPDGKVLFVGHFHPATADLAAERLKSLDPFLATAPTKGAAKPDVTIIEFSDFECPSCKHASGYVDAAMEKFPNQIRYVRFDLPLVSMHPWALSAAMYGRAIYRQKPDAFWDYKKQIYANQDKMNAFTLDDFARGFAQDHELDMKQYEADLESEVMRDDLLKGVGAAFSNDVRATPTYMVNGVYVDPGDDGKALEDYVSGLLKK